MRCNNCGWDNPAEQLKCLKCNSILTDSIAPAESVREKSDDKNFAGKTIAGGQSDLAPWNKDDNQALQNNNLSYCINCGYPVSHGADKCPKCGTAIAREQDMLKKTINPYSKIKSPVCNFSLLPRIDEKEIKKIKLEGNIIDLNRSSVEPENESLSREMHAKLEFMDGNWYISNPGDKPTFIKVNNPVRLEPGDVVLLGDRMVRFDNII